MRSATIRRHRRRSRRRSPVSTPRTGALHRRRQPARVARELVQGPWDVAPIRIGEALELELQRDLRGQEHVVDVPLRVDEDLLSRKTRDDDYYTSN